jgi:hypothetical protein
MEEKSMKRNYGGGIIGRGIVEKESLRREASGRHLGGIWEESLKHLGGIFETSGMHMGGIWEASGRHLGGIWETSGRHLRSSQGLQEARRLQVAGMQKLYSNVDFSQRF